MDHRSEGRRIGPVAPLRGARFHSIEGIVPTLSLVIPHWPLDEETNEALRRCVSSFPVECERIVVVNEGTGYARNVNTGLRLATRDYIAVVNNDCRLADGDVYDLCVPETVTSPLVIGERQGFGVARTRRLPRLLLGGAADGPRFYGVFPRCSLCPLFDGERAIRDVLRENPPPAAVLEITLGPTLRALLQGEVPPHLVEGSDPDLEVPDFVPEGWAEPRGEEPPG